ncbi:M2-2 protein [human respiratory syncytial virus]|uniref:M2-2 protein n=1 Tax=Human respiratory syncytial virus TaxID=11250 RepID=UPI000EFA309C|nr:M2-2 protein [Human orthopneumovirus]WVD50470.1 M2-2 protein [Human respiratory syncytial virus A]WVD51042.1 M2-2 protein [Human respiratory syncytial virus A]
MTMPKIMILPDKYPCSITSILITSRCRVTMYNQKNTLYFNQNNPNNHMYSPNQTFNEIHWTSQELIDTIQIFLQHLGIIEDIYTIYILVS